MANRNSAGKNGSRRIYRSVEILISYKIDTCLALDTRPFAVGIAVMHILAVLSRTFFSPTRRERVHELLRELS
jgi:hypothetical protein